jgi:hypothetical protein
MSGRAEVGSLPALAPATEFRPSSDLLETWEKTLLKANLAEAQQNEAWEASQREARPSPGADVNEDAQESEDAKAQRAAMSGFNDDDEWKAESAQDGTRWTGQRAQYLSSLRKKVGGEEASGFQPHAIRRPERRKEAPAWVIDDAKFEAYERHLGKEHPTEQDKLNVGCSMWYLYLYYRVGLTDAEIGAEFGVKTKRVKEIIRRRKKRGDNFFNKLAEKPTPLQTTYEERRRG